MNLDFPTINAVLIYGLTIVLHRLSVSFIFIIQVFNGEDHPKQKFGRSDSYSYAIEALVFPQNINKFD